MLHALLCVAGLLSSATFARAEAQRTVTEIRLPEFQAEAMASDLPARDLLIDGGGVLWTVGKTSLWRWDLAANRLKRWPLHSNADDRSTLQRVGTDGLSMFAASGSTLYQLQLAQSRLFRYGIPLASPRARVLGFAGQGDELWVLHASGTLRFDRYGKRLEARKAFPALGQKDRVAFDTGAQRLWIARGSQLLRAELAPGAKSEPTVALKAKHRILDVQLAGPDLIVHTAHTVLRLNRDTGRSLQSVPVEGRRKLLRMAATDVAHAYLFDDRSLEAYVIKRRQAFRFRLPLDESEQTGRFVLRDNRVAIVVDGRPRVFVLGGM